MGPILMQGEGGWRGSGVSLQCRGGHRGWAPGPRPTLPWFQLTQAMAFSEGSKHRTLPPPPLKGLFSSAGSNLGHPSWHSLSVVALHKLKL